MQDVIKTIRDSLYLVIDLHFENNDVESVADIQMKHNLLQQVNERKAMTITPEINEKLCSGNRARSYQLLYYATSTLDCMKCSQIAFGLS